MVEARIDRLEVRLASVEQAIIRIEAGLASTATKAELGDKPSWRWGIKAMAATYATAIVADTVSALLLTHFPHQ